MSDVPLVPEVVEEQRHVGETHFLLSYLSSVDHKQIGIMYLWTTLGFFIGGGIEALLMRIQLMHASNTFLSPEAYNAIFTMHGTTMIFLVVMPMLIGFATYIVPLMVGARDMAFPRMNALSYWLFIFGGLLMYFSFWTGHPPSIGWFGYAPLSEKPFSFNDGVDYWAFGMIVTGIGTTTAGLNLIVTMLMYRAPGLKMTRLPLFAWMTLVNGFLIIYALPALNASLVELLADRRLGAHFFQPQHGGGPILWQHLFWSFGHPEVYIMILPGWGIISEVIPVFSRKPIYGYTAVALSTVAIGLLSFGVWVHHMFADGISRWQYFFFSGASFLIGVPTGIKIWNWIATMWAGKVRFTTAMLFATAFLIEFTMGGLTGIVLATVPIDWQVTDTYFVVAHMHYVLFGGTVFAMTAGIYYWFPKMTGKLMSEKIGKWHFWTMIIGFNGTFLIQHVLGLEGMTRREWTYPALPGWTVMNMISSIGAFALAASVAIFLFNLFYSLKYGKAAGDNPWSAWTLEWATTSPPPTHNFDKVPPVRSRRPLWDLAHPEKPDWKRGKEAHG